VARQQQELALGAVTWTIVDASGSPEETLTKARIALLLPPPSCLVSPLH